MPPFESSTHMTSDHKIRTLTVLLEDHPGSLFKVTALIRRRGFNIETLSVGPSEFANKSRMTLTVDARLAHADQVAKQLAKLLEVISVKDITDENYLEREMVLVEVYAPVGKVREQLMLSTKGLVVAYDKDVLVYEFTGPPQEIEENLEHLKDFKILEMVRSGPLALKRIKT